jgi:hypothetical protein
MADRRHLGNAGPLAALLGVIFGAMTFLGLSGQNAQLQITPEMALIDERFRITLDGVRPGRDVIVRTDGNYGQWQSTATYRSDRLGHVEIADPMKLIWSATGERPPAGTFGTLVQPWTFTADVGGQVIATSTITRRAIAENVRIVPVRERGLVATAFYPPGAGPHPAIIVLPGSQGGLPGPGGPPGGLASRGYVVLGLAYFNAAGFAPAAAERSARILRERRRMVEIAALRRPHSRGSPRHLARRRAGAATRRDLSIGLLRRGRERPQQCGVARIEQ